VEAIERRHLPPIVQMRTKDEGSLTEAQIRLELAKAGWIVTRAAAEVGVSARHLHRIMRVHGIKRPESVVA
jgi:transcriptional regulator of acetoin/glycerol metabolism